MLFTFNLGYACRFRFILEDLKYAEHIRLPSIAKKGFRKPSLPSFGRRLNTSVLFIIGSASYVMSIASLDNILLISSLGPTNISLFLGAARFGPYLIYSFVFFRRYLCTFEAPIKG